MNLLFYLFGFIFIWSEIYIVYNKSRLNTNFRNKDIKSITKTDSFYYFTRFLFFIWIIVGLWSSQSDLFLLLTTLNFIKFPTFHFNKKIYAIWDNLLPGLNILQILIIIAFAVFS